MEEAKESLACGVRDGGGRGLAHATKNPRQGPEDGTGSLGFLVSEMTCFPSSDVGTISLESAIDFPAGVTEQGDL